MIKRVIMKHIELMSVCQTHSFDVLVSLTNLIRFYTYIVANVFLGAGSYDHLMHDAAIFGRHNQQENPNASTGQTDSSQFSVTPAEYDRVSNHLIHHFKFEDLREELVNMQAFSESFSASSQRPEKSKLPSFFETNSPVEESTCLNLRKAL